MGYALNDTVFRALNNYRPTQFLSHTIRHLDGEVRREEDIAKMMLFVGSRLQSLEIDIREVQYPGRFDVIVSSHLNLKYICPALDKIVLRVGQRFTEFGHDSDVGCASYVRCLPFAPSPLMVLHPVSPCGNADAREPGALWPSRWHTFLRLTPFLPFTTTSVHRISQSAHHGLQKAAPELGQVRAALRHPQVLWRSIRTSEAQTIRSCRISSNAEGAL